MADEQSTLSPETGQAAEAPWSDQGTTEAAPAPQTGQAGAPYGQDQGQAPESTPATGETAFFDPNNLPPEVLPAYKQMQAAFTTKTQELARQRQKIEAYDAFMRDPITSLQNVAAQYGLHITRAQAAQQLQQQQAQPQQPWEPQSWDEVENRIVSAAEQRAEERVLQRLAPYLGQVQQMQAQGIEQQLNSLDPNWRTYEGNMRHLLGIHPTLVNDVATLYRLAVPPEALEAKAIQQALRKFDQKAQHSGVTQGGPSPRSKPAAPQVKSFDDAVRLAKQQISSGE